MKGAKSGRIVAIAFVMALGLAGSIYTGYWSKMERYVTSIVSPASVTPPAWVKAAQGLQGAGAEGGAAAGTTGAAAGAVVAADAGAGAAYHGGGSAGVPVAAGGQAVHGGPQSTGFNASLLPRIAGYATVLGLFAALVRLVDLLRKRRLAARSVEARLAAGSTAAPATGVAGAAGLAGAVAREAP
jgi:hypothetical protein